MQAKVQPVDVLSQSSLPVKMDTVTHDDLTNLSWVAGISVPMNSSVSPPNSRFQRHRSTSANRSNNLTHSTSKSNKDTRRSMSSTKIQNGLNMNVDRYGNKKPNCSYACLITMALRAAANSNIGGCLPVHEIYKCIEDLFPFFKNAPDGWKNSVRHNLSLGTTFRKVMRNEGWQGKKGYFWEISPDHSPSIDKEVEKFLASLGEGKTSDVLKTPPTLSAASTRKSTETKSASKGTPHSHKSKLKKMPTATTSEEKSREELTHSEIAMYSPQMQTQLKKSRTPVTPNTVPTLDAFDTNSTPSQFVGIQTPQSDDVGAARELFENGPTTEPTSTYNCTYSFHGEVMPLSTAPAYNMYGIPTMMMSYPDSSSPIMGISPTSSDGNSPYASPPYVSYVPMSMFPPILVSPYCWGAHPGQYTPQGISSQMYHQNCQRTRDNMNEEFENEDPMDLQQRSSTGSTKKRKKPTACKSRKKIKTCGCSRRLNFDELEEDSDSKSCAASTPPPSLIIDDRQIVSNQNHLLPRDRQQEEMEEDILIDNSSQNVSHLTEAHDEFESQVFAYASPLLDIHGLSREKIRELEEMVGNTTELNSLFSSTQSSLQTTPDKTKPMDNQSPRPTDLEAFSDKSENQELKDLEPIKQIHVSSIPGPFDVIEVASPLSCGVPALGSLLDLADASIMDLERALNVEEERDDCTRSF